MSHQKKLLQEFLLLNNLEKFKNNFFIYSIAQSGWLTLLEEYVQDCSVSYLQYASFSLPVTSGTLPLRSQYLERE